MRRSRGNQAKGSSVPAPMTPGAIAWRCLAVIVSISLAVELLLAPLAYVCFDHHDCAGDDCAVCELFEVVRAVTGKPASTPVPTSAQLVRKVLPAAAPLGLLA